MSSSSASTFASTSTSTSPSSTSSSSFLSTASSYFTAAMSAFLPSSTFSSSYTSLRTPSSFAFAPAPMHIATTAPSSSTSTSTSTSTSISTSPSTSPSPSPSLSPSVPYPVLPAPPGQVGGPAILSNEPPEVMYQNCLKYKQNALQNKMVRFMFASLKKAGCPAPNLDFIQCIHCEHRGLRGGFRMDQDGKSEVVLCSNYLLGPKHFHDSLVHELVHAYDRCRADTDFTDCKQHACTEVRASNLSGQCAMKEEIARLFVKQVFFSAGHMKSCVRRHATLSVSGNPSCPKPGEAVDLVFDRCYQDIAPFKISPYGF